jgi:hypothetical protein
VAFGESLGPEVSILAQRVKVALTGAVGIIGRFGPKLCRVFLGLPQAMSESIFGVSLAKLDKLRRLMPGS